MAAPIFAQALVETKGLHQRSKDAVGTGVPGASFAIQLPGYKPNGEPRMSPWVLLLRLH